MTWPLCCTDNQAPSNWRSPPTPRSSDQSAPSCASWLDHCDLSTQLAQDALVAAGEAVANAIEHGHRDRPGHEITLRAAVTANRLQLTVSDSGRWLPPGPEPAPYRGKGLTLMQAMMDNVSIDAGEDGTTVTMDVRISREQSA